jgi:hypothetical protein
LILSTRGGALQQGVAFAYRLTALAAYAERKTEGTDFIAIRGWLEAWTWGAEENLRRKRGQEKQEQIEREKGMPRLGCAPALIAFGLPPQA